MSARLLDGASGTLLLDQGHAPASLTALPDEAPSAVRAVHRAYPDADAITTCTFGLPRFDGAIAPIATAALALARDAAGGRLVVASLGPGKRLAEAARALRDADVLLLETFQSLAQLQAALDEITHPRRWATVSFRDGRTTDGWTPEDVAARLAGRVEAVGANCGDGLEATTRAAIAMVGAGVPVIGRPSAGVGETCSPDAFADAARRMWEAGVTYVGGCCGAGPAHIAAAATTRRTLRAPPRR